MTTVHKVIHEIDKVDRKKAFFSLIDFRPGVSQCSCLKGNLEQKEGGTSVHGRTLSCSSDYLFEGFKSGLKDLSIKMLDLQLIFLPGVQAHSIL